MAVILALEDCQSLMQTLEILSDPPAFAEIRDARARMDDGAASGEDDVRAALTAHCG